MEPWTQMPQLFCFHSRVCNCEPSSALPLNKALETSRTFKILDLMEHMSSAGQDYTQDL